MIKPTIYNPDFLSDGRMKVDNMIYKYDYFTDSWIEDENLSERKDGDTCKKCSGIINCNIKIDSCFCY